jgi:hypothetical protein
MPVFAGTAAVPSRRPADSVIDHNILLASTIAAALGLALVLGFIAARVKLPSLVGYLLTGVLIGTFTPGFVADIRLADELAEIGAMLLMFGATWWSSCARADRARPGIQTHARQEKCRQQEEGIEPSSWATVFEWCGAAWIPARKPG